MKNKRLKTINRLVCGVLACLLICSGCAKAPMNRDIEGMWRLEEFTTNDDGKVHPCERLYYSIQLWVVEVAEKQGSHGYRTSIGRFSYGENDKTVVMEDFQYRSSTGDSGKETEVKDLLPYGINSSRTVFDVVKADGKTLILKSDYATLRLTSF